jgi:hypothetical protein
MKIRLGKYLLELKRSDTVCMDKPSGPGAGKSLPGADNEAANTDKSPAIPNINDINTIEFVSHELKGVLGSTILCVYSIRDGLLGMLNFKQRASVETTIRNLRRLESTIKDFLDISRPENKY